MSVCIEKASEYEIEELTKLRIAYLQEDFGNIAEQDLQCMEEALPQYFKNHLNRDLTVLVAKENEKIVSCAFLLIVEKPMSPAFLTGKTGTVLNVYTKPEYRKKGYARQLMYALLSEAKERDFSSIISRIREKQESKENEPSFLRATLKKRFASKNPLEDYHDAVALLDNYII